MRSFASIAFWSVSPALAREGALAAAAEAALSEKPAAFEALPVEEIARVRTRLTFSLRSPVRGEA